ncbi:hypothetical protein PoB_001089000 [Plakobranchus ocellatus]|uniref:Uncharacterized protein n=1 Tax=Plakobranchus ocellatus TaxID=259542 RepID=A0AAV3YPJ9_9GAST|nr:hypothetical protein PoB_001089000 [Plakobranchus ocellatus]
MLTSQLAILIRTARASRKQQYPVCQMNNEDITDWEKIYYQQKKSTDNGTTFKWPDTMNISLEKNYDDEELLFDSSHFDCDFAKIMTSEQKVRKKASSLRLLLHLYLSPI